MVGCWWVLVGAGRGQAWWSESTRLSPSTCHGVEEQGYFLFGLPVRRRFPPPKRFWCLGEAPSTTDSKSLNGAWPSDSSARRGHHMPSAESN